MEFTRTGEAIKDFQNFVRAYNLSTPEVKFTEVKPKKPYQPRIYHCVIKVRLVIPGLALVVLMEITCPFSDRRPEVLQLPE